MSLFTRRPFHRLASLLIRDKSTSSPTVAVAAAVAGNDVKSKPLGEDSSGADGSSQLTTSPQLNAAAGADDSSRRASAVVASNQKLEVAAKATTVAAAITTAATTIATVSQVADVDAAIPQPATTAVAASDAAEIGSPKRKSGLGPRWSYIVTRGTIVAAIWAFFAYAFDPLLKFGLVKSTETAVGAKVDVGNFSTTLFPPRIEINEMEVANVEAPDRNWFEFGDLTASVSGSGLLKASYIIDEVTVTGIRWDTPRETSGQLEKSAKPIDDADNQGPGMLDQAGEMGKQWADGLLSRAKLDYDPGNYESFRLVDRYEDEWKSDFESLETRINAVDDRYKNVRDLIKNANGKPLERIRAYEQARVDGTQLLRDLNKLKVDLASLPGKARDDLGTLNEARKRDTAEIQAKVKNLFDGNGDDLSEFLLGPDLHHRVQRGLAWFKWADSRVDEYQNQPKPKRFRGDDIEFETLEPMPKFLVRLVNVNGSGRIGGDQMSFEGTIRDVTSDPVLHGKPILMRIEGKGEGVLQVKSTFDRTQAESPNNVIEFDYVLPRLVEQHLGNKDSLKVTVAAKDTRWHGKFTTRGDEIEGTVSMFQSPVTMVAELDDKVDARLRNIVTSSFQKVQRIDAVVRVSGTVAKPRMKLETNLGKVISEGVREGLQDQIATETDALIAKLNATFTEKQQGLVTMFNGQHTKLTDAVKLQETDIQSLIPKLGSGGNANNAFDPTKLFR